MPRRISLPYNPPHPLILTLTRGSGLSVADREVYIVRVGQELVELGNVASGGRSTLPFSLCVRSFIVHHFALHGAPESPSDRYVLRLEARSTNGFVQCEIVLNPKLCHASEATATKPVLGSGTVHCP